jgi:hypothetical protein
MRATRFHHGITAWLRLTASSWAPSLEYTPHTYAQQVAGHSRNHCWVSHCHISYILHSAMYMLWCGMRHVLLQVL